MPGGCQAARSALVSTGACWSRARTRLSWARAVAALCTELTATETVFPTTKLRLVYELAGGRPAGEGSGSTPDGG